MLQIAGITTKLLIWFLFFVLVFFSTVFVLYINVHRMMTISDNVVNQHYLVASASKKMLESLLSLEENEKKFLLMQKKDYLDYFLAAQAAFETSLGDILAIEATSETVSDTWRELHARFRQVALLPDDLERINHSQHLWIPESEINAWIEMITAARLENESRMEQASRELNRQGFLALKTGLAGLGVALLVGVIGGATLSHAMVRPLKSLLQGIRSVSHDRPIEAIPIKSNDEFAELAASFNEMARRLAEEQRMRSDFISTLSHEIRTPLTSIRESINLINEGIMGEVNERQERFLTIAGYEIGRVSELLNRIMQVSYLESGALEIDSRPLEIAPFVKQCIEPMKAAVASKGISIVTEITPELPCVHGDPKYLEQVFVNLVENAVKFSPPQATVRVVVEYAAGTLCVKVIDQGPGVPADEQPYIFNKYYRAKGMRNHKDGVGLGLSIVRHIIETHGGRIWLVSEEGNGATIEFTLPVVKKPESGRVDL
jgi:signal transduction histidine kinase